jgi:hypothetical protein
MPIRLTKLIYRLWLGLFEDAATLLHDSKLWFVRLRL